MEETKQTAPLKYVCANVSALVSVFQFIVPWILLTICKSEFCILLIRNILRSSMLFLCSVNCSADMCETFNLLFVYSTSIEFYIFLSQFLEGMHFSLIVCLFFINPVICDSLVSWTQESGITCLADCACCYFVYLFHCFGNCFSDSMDLVLYCQAQLVA